MFILGLGKFLAHVYGEFGAIRGFSVPSLLEILATRHPKMEFIQEKEQVRIGGGGFTKQGQPPISEITIEVHRPHELSLSPAERPKTGSKIPTQVKNSKRKSK